MASRRMQRTKSFSSYINAINQDVNLAKAKSDITSLSAGAITGSSFSEDIVMFGSSIKSYDYVGGESGWKIDGTGVAEFADVYVRGDINAQTGTIGYWNISSPGVIRRIGPSTQFGTFLESEDVGPNDDSKTSGVYVGLFKSYFENPVPLINRRRVSNVATITIQDNTFVAGDRVVVDVVEDATYNNGGLPVTIIAATGDSISYLNTGSDYPAAASITTTDTTSTGTVTFYNPDIAGLYIKDYGKADIDYGYFSSAGLAFVSGSRVNLVHNPSFEFIKSANITAISGSGTTVTYSASSTGFAAGKTVTIENADTDAYNLVNATIATSNTAGFTVTSAATGTTSTATAYSKVSTTAGWNYVAATTNPIGLIEFSNLSNSYLTSSEYGGIVSWSNTMSTSYTVDGTVAYNKGLTYNLFSNERVLALSYDSFVDYNPFTAVATSVFAHVANTSQMVINTSGAHGLSTGDLIYCDFVASLLAEDWEFGPGVLTVTDILSSTSFRVVNPNGTFQPTSAITPTAIDGRDTKIYHAVHPAAPLDQIKFKFGNGSSTAISNVVNDITTASWTTNSNKYLYQSIDTWMAQYLVPTYGIPPLKPVAKAPIYIDSEKLRLEYASLDATNFDAEANITLSIPAALYQQTKNPGYTTSNIAYMTSVVTATAISGSGTVVTVTAPNNFAVGDTVTITGASTAAYNTIVNATIATASPTQFTVASTATGTTSSATATAYRPVRQLFDSVSLSTEPVAFYGDFSDDYSWEDPTLNSAAQISIQDPKKWVDIDLSTQTGYVANLDYVSLKQSRLNEPMLSQPSIEADSDYASDIGSVFAPDYNYETLKLSSGIISVYDGANYVDYESRHNLAVSKTKAVNQLTAEAGTSRSYITLQTDYSGSDSITFGANSISTLSTSTFYVNTIQTLPLSFETRVSFPTGITTDGFSYIGGSSFTVAPFASFQDGASSTTLRLTSTTQYNTTSTDHAFQIGATGSDNVRMDTNGIQALTTANAVSALNINTFGGDITLGSSTSDIYSDGIYATVVGTTGTRDVYVNSSGLVGVASTSSRRFKREITPLTVDVEKVLSIEPVTFKYNPGVLHESENPESVQIGFIAEDLDAAGLTNLVDYDADGLPQGILYSRYIIALQAVVRHQASQIESLSSRLDALEGN